MGNKLTRDEWAALVEVLDQGEYWVGYKETEYTDGESFEYELVNGRHVDAGELLRLLGSAFDKLQVMVKVEGR